MGRLRSSGSKNPQEAKKFGLLALVFFFIIGSYWLLRPLKEAVFFHTVGSAWQPTVKWVTIFFVAILVLIYGKLVDIYHRHTLFYIIGSVYTVLFIGIWYLLGHPEIGLANKILDPTRLIGWFAYIAIESFGYLMAAHFWSFVASSTDATTARSGYPVIVSIAQLGALIASIVVSLRYFNERTLLLLCVLSILCVMLLIRELVLLLPYESRTGQLSCSTVKPHRSGFFEGLWLLCTRPYLLGIFGLVFFYEVVGSIVDLQMLKQAELVPEYSTAAGLAAFGGFFGICVNAMSFTMALLGTRYLIRKLGMVICLIAFPLCLGMGVLWFTGVLYFTTLSANATLWSLFGLFVLAKGLSYALNNPAKEMMYIPTSKDVQFKAKGWIDMFGARAAKACGAQINGMLIAGGNVLYFLQMGSLVSLGCIGLWICVAIFVGTFFTTLTKQGRIVE